MTLTPTIMKAIRARRAYPNHPFVLWVDSLGSTILRWAEEHRVSRQSVSCWIRSGARGPKIPRGIAEVIEQESRGAVPVSCWARIAERKTICQVIIRGR